MGTKDFNIFDKVIAKWRLSKVTRHIEKNDVVLDFGCGSQGYFLKLVLPVIKSGVGFDYDVAEQKINNIEFIKDKLDDTLPFKSSSFSKIVMLAVLEHLPLNKVIVQFKEFHRVLKKDGKIVLTTPTTKSKPVLEFLAAAGIINAGEVKDHKKYYTREDIGNLAKATGFTIELYNLFQLGLNSVAILKKA